VAELSFYQQDTRALLRDQNALFTGTTQLNRWINAGRRQVAKVTGCIRILIAGQSSFGGQAQAGSMIPGAIVPGQEVGAGSLGSDTTLLSTAKPTNTFNTIPGVEKYPFSYAKPYLRRWNAGADAVNNILDVGVSWGGIRPNLDWMPWDDLQAYARSYNIGVTSYPFVWSTNGDGANANLWLFPIPISGPASGTGEMEWDCECTPLDLVDNTSVDLIPSGFDEAVKYYAAYLSLLPTRPALAEAMETQFYDHLGIDRVATDRGRVPSYYYMYQ